MPMQVTTSYEDGRGQMGLTITLGSGHIICRSSRIKCITRSSSESELYALEEASTYVIWMRLLMNELGYPPSGPTKVFQDNQSTIIMATSGGSFKRTKHLICKQSFVKERIANGDMHLCYLPTNRMVADMLTKPLPRALLQKLMTLLGIC